MGVKAQRKVTNKVTVGVRMDPDLREAAVAVARQNDLHMSTVVNAALLYFLRSSSQQAALVKYMRHEQD